MRLQNPQNWFHVNSEWRKKSVILTLWRISEIQNLNNCPLFYRNPEESFVVPREVESGYEAPEINYAEPEEQTYEVPQEAYEHPQEPTAYSPPVTYSPVQYNDQFSKPPYVAPSNTDVKYHAYPSASGNAASKPPVSKLELYFW